MSRFVLAIALGTSLFSSEGLRPSDSPTRSLAGTPERPAPLACAHSLRSFAALIRPLEAHRGELSLRESAYVLVDATSQRILEARWDDLERPLPLGSLIKPFTAVAYADTHRFTYPMFTCEGTANGCWLPGGHGRVGISAAISHSCNAYFRQLAQHTAPDALASRLQWFGVRANTAMPTNGSMVGFGDELKLAPAAIIRGYLELASRATQPGISPIVEGLLEAARTGTGRGVGAAIHGANALVKTGTAPCSHSRRATADGYTIVLYPADRPRVVLLVQAHGRTGADSAVVAGELLRSGLLAR